MSAEIRERRAAAREALRRGRAAAGHGAVPLAHVLLRDARLLLVALWLGGAVFFSFAVAPAAFEVLHTRELAGTLVTRTLGVVNVAGFAASLLLLLSAPLGRGSTGRGALAAEAASLAVIAAMTAAGHWVIAARMLALRAQMRVPIDDVSPADPLRAAFGSLHGYSVAALGVAMLAGVAALLLVARRARAGRA